MMGRPAYQAVSCGKIYGCSPVYVDVCRVKPLLFPGLDGCASVALVYAWRVSREKNQSQARRASVCDIQDHKAERRREQTQGAGGVTDIEWSQSIMWLDHVSNRDINGVRVKQWGRLSRVVCLSSRCCWAKRSVVRGFVSTLQWKFLKSWIKRTYNNNKHHQRGI